MEEDDPFDGEELLDLDALMAKVCGETGIDAMEYITDAESELLSSEPSVDTTRTDHNWRVNLRTEILEKHTETDFIDSDDDEFDEDMDQPQKVPQVSSVRDAIRLAS